MEPLLWLREGCVYSVFPSSSSTRRSRRARRWCDVRLPFGASRNATAVAIACGKWTRSRDPSIATRIAGANKAEEQFFCEQKDRSDAEKELYWSGAGFPEQESSARKRQKNHDLECRVHRFEALKIGRGISVFRKTDRQQQATTAEDLTLRGGDSTLLGSERRERKKERKRESSWRIKAWRRGSIPPKWVRKRWRTWACRMPGSRRGRVQGECYTSKEERGWVEQGGTRWRWRDWQWW